MNEDDRYIIDSILSHFKSDVKEVYIFIYNIQIVDEIKDPAFETQYNELWMLLQPQDHEKIHEV